MQKAEEYFIQGKYKEAVDIYNRVPPDKLSFNNLLNKAKSEAAISNYEEGILTLKAAEKKSIDDNQLSVVYYNLLLFHYIILIFAWKILRSA
ncbi:hypothetical protein [Fonticella tunisiensis]|uniref:hypothetical protein n=1 Tax=Fonticella tunisiensis TaxID=1096341 RepID=UPI00105EBE47|nr:hypothetical protein [Fonticella tunisiensis]